MAGMSRTKFDFSHLTADERVELAEELWDSLAEIQGALPLTGPQQEELDRRLADYQEDQGPGLALGRGFGQDQRVRRVNPALSLRPVAAAEIQDAFRWYEQQRKGLGG